MLSSSVPLTHLLIIDSTDVWLHVHLVPPPIVVIEREGDFSFFAMSFLPPCVYAAEVIVAVLVTRTALCGAFLRSRKTGGKLVTKVCNLGPTVYSLLTLQNMTLFVSPNHTAIPKQLNQTSETRIIGLLILIATIRRELENIHNHNRYVFRSVFRFGRNVTMTVNPLTETDVDVLERTVQ